MTTDQIILFTLFALVFAALLWGRWRYDIVAFTALVIALLLHVVPTEEAFSGFGHPATIIVALVLVVSRGLLNSGAVDLITRLVIDQSRSIGAHILTLGGVAGLLSGFMNNVAALALLMPVDIQASQKAGRTPGQTLMPLSFATILGGLFTLIGTPPNIIIASFRETALGEPYQMFDFAPVGLITAVVGIAFVAFIGWRLIPVPQGSKNAAKDLAELEGYVAELAVPKGSKSIGIKVRDLDGVAEENDCEVLGLARRGKRLPGRARAEEIRANDRLVIKASPDAINALAGALGLTIKGQTGASNALSGDLVLSEAVVTADSRLVGRSAMNVRLLGRYGVSLLGISRQGRTIREQIRKTELMAGDILLLVGTPDRVEDVVSRMGCLPLAERGLQVIQHGRAGLAIGLFLAAIVAASFGWIYLPVALAAVVVAFVFTDIVPLRELYDTIEWPVVILLGSFIPLGAALEASGGTDLIANGIATLTGTWPAWATLTVLMVVTMTLSDVLNNTATAVVAAPVAVSLADSLGANPDPFLMAVAVAASCAFLTPIGHKNNMLILGPGGYSFGDYWRMGLPLEIIVIATAVPAILVFWPL
ncbi:SLC13 family permease [Cucumibacter marinus]|uniref:SLC13 family permease n=1 Tax=Cucumibacter marinus TaxID=1121252 RepID=UPI0003F89E2C|nr:SLC13 family permease [Cucumibacter marinus]